MILAIISEQERGWHEVILMTHAFFLIIVGPFLLQGQKRMVKWVN
jgi:hypothetical protein